METARVLRFPRGFGNDDPRHQHLQNDPIPGHKKIAGLAIPNRDGSVGALSPGPYWTLYINSGPVDRLIKPSNQLLVWP